MYLFIQEIEILRSLTDKLTKNDKSKSHVRLLLRLEFSLIAIHTWFTGSIDETFSDQGRYHSWVYDYIIIR